MVFCKFVWHHEITILTNMTQISKSTPFCRIFIAIVILSDPALLGYGLGAPPGLIVNKSKFIGFGIEFGSQILWDFLIKGNREDTEKDSTKECRRSARYYNNNNWLTGLQIIIAVRGHIEGLEQISGT